MSEGKPAVPVRQVLQVCVVVRDLQRAMERYWNVLGIGPWRIHTYHPPRLTDTTLRGKSQPYTMRLALAEVGLVQWELIQPLEGPSIYKEFLEEKGEGLHHVAFAVDDYDQAVGAFKKQGIGILMSGTVDGGTYAYMDTQEALGMIAEVYRRPPDHRPLQPEAVWPSQA